MAKLPPRNRVIYQSEALFISPDATGKHIYYMPPLSSSEVTGCSSSSVDYERDCFVTGSGAAGTTKVFDACAGTGVTSKLDYKYKMYNCTGAGTTGNVNTHAVLADDGLLSVIS